MMYGMGQVGMSAATRAALAAKVAEARSEWQRAATTVPNVRARIAISAGAFDAARVLVSRATGGAVTLSGTQFYSLLLGSMAKAEEYIKKAATIAALATDARAAGVIDALLAASRRIVRLTQEASAQARSAAGMGQISFWDFVLLGPVLAPLAILSQLLSSMQSGDQAVESAGRLVDEANRIARESGRDPEAVLREMLDARQRIESEMAQQSVISQLGRAGRDIVGEPLLGGVGDALKWVIILGAGGLGLGLLWWAWPVLSGSRRVTKVAAGRAERYLTANRRRSRRPRRNSKKREKEVGRYRHRSAAQDHADGINKHGSDHMTAKVRKVASRSTPGASSYAVIVSPKRSYIKVWDRLDAEDARRRS